jgi:putative addiction module killer protein
MYSIREYVSASGKNYYREWLRNIPKSDAARIDRRLANALAGNLGDIKAIREGLAEMRLHFGPGYRVYFGFEGREIIVLLIGSSKDDQSRVIPRALDLWRQYKKERNANGELPR